MKKIGRVLSTTIIVTAMVVFVFGLWTYLENGGNIILDVRAVRAMAQVSQVQPVSTFTSIPKLYKPPSNTETSTNETTPTPTTAIQPTETPQPAPENNVVVITVEPTNPVKAKVLPQGFAKVNIPAEMMRGVSFKVITKTVVEGGKERTVTSKIPYLTGDSCNSFTKRDGVAVTYLMSKRFGQSFKYTGPLIGSESAFLFYDYDGPNKECVANQNDWGAPAYCAGQIYSPNGGGGATHPEFDLYPPSQDSRASLQDPVYCMAAAMKVYKVDFGGNGIQAAANYKGYSDINNPEFTANYNPWYNAGGVDAGGVFIPFTDDDATIRSLLGPEIEKWEKSINEFYALFPNFWGH